jgi:hypothetical protein
MSCIKLKVTLACHASSLRLEQESKEESNPMLNKLTVVALAGRNNRKWLSIRPRHQDRTMPV